MNNSMDRCLTTASTQPMCSSYRRDRAPCPRSSLAAAWDPRCRRQTTQCCNRPRRPLSWKSAAISIARLGINSHITYIIAIITRSPAARKESVPAPLEIAASAICDAKIAAPLTRSHAQPIRLLQPKAVLPLPCPLGLTIIDLHTYIHYNVLVRLRL